jgi:hypothetical protein
MTEAAESGTFVRAAGRPVCGCVSAVVAGTVRGELASWEDRPPAASTVVVVGVETSARGVREDRG